MKAYEEMLELRGRQVHRITLEEEQGMRVELLNLGATITCIQVPDRWGVYENVVLAYDDPSLYLENPHYFGALIGRTAGRIQGAVLRMEGVQHPLDANYGTDCGHGGSAGFHGKLLSFTLFETKDQCGVHFHGVSPDGEGGYPGRVDFKVTVTLKKDQVLEIRYEGGSDKDTVLNLSNHTYFNLSGDFSESIKYHELYLAADVFAEIDASGNVTGRLRKVAGSPFDFNFMHEIGEEMGEAEEQLDFGSGYDHPFLLDTSRTPQIRLAHRFSGRTLEMETSNQGVVVYTQNHNEKVRITGGKMLEKQRSVALEVQKLPIGAEGAFQEHSFLKKGERFEEWTRYRFKID